MSHTLRYQQRPPEAARTPNETAARLRADLASANDAVQANALLNAAECSTCAFRHIDQCRAWPPRPLASGQALWPRVNPSDWCGCWRSH